MARIYQLCGKNDYVIKFGINIPIERVEDIFKKYNYITIEKEKDFLKMAKEESQCYIYDYGDIVFFNISDTKELENISKEIETCISSKN